MKAPYAMWRGKYLLGLLLVWVLVHALLYAQYGVNNLQEAQTYEGVARQWLQGKQDAIGIQFVFYAGYIALRMVQLKWQMPIEFVYAVQLLFSLVSVFAFAGILKKLGSTPKSTFAGTLLYITCPVIATWNNFLYTDALFTYLLVIGLYLLVKPRSGIWAHALLWIAIGILPFFRPVGFLFAITCILYWWLVEKPALRYKSMALAGLLALLALAGIYYVFTHAKGYFYPQHNTTLNIICSIPSHLEALVTVPYQPQKGVLHFMLHNPGVMVQLFGWRFWKMLWMTRPYFSTGHNAVIIIQMVVYYTMALAGMLALFWQNKKLLSWLLLSLLLWLLPAMLLCADWANRFVLPAFVFILILSACCFQWPISKASK